MNGKCIVVLAVLGAVMSCCDTAHGDIVFYTNESEWLAAVPGPVQTFEITDANLAKADQVPAPPAPDTSVGGVLTFNNANTGLPWSFELRTLEPDAEFVFSDALAPDTPETLSVGRVNVHEDDDWQVQVTEGPSLYAFAFYLGDNGDYGEIPDENFTVHAEGQSATSYDIPEGPGLLSFLGAISTTPIQSVEFDEDDGLDDIVIGNFHFVPEPATVSLLALGGLGLIRRREPHVSL